MLKATIRTLAPDVDTIALYNDYIADTPSRSRNLIQQDLENIFAKTYNAKNVGGNKKLVPDYKADSLTDELLATVPFRVNKDGTYTIEAKVKYRSESTGTTIGSSSVTSVLAELSRAERRGVYDIAEGGENADVEQLIKAIKQKYGSGDANLFTFLSQFAKKTHAQAYNKAKNLTIIKYDGSKVSALEIFFPKSKFTTQFFGAKTYSSSESGFSFYYYLNDPFEKALINAIKISTDQAAESGFKKSIYKNTLTYRRGSVKVLEPIEFRFAHSDSIPMLNVKAIVARKSNNQKALPSIIDISQAVQGRVKLKMRRTTGEPSPPKIAERSGTFRNSIRAYINTRTKITSYFYIPYYDSLERYGYEITNMVENSIRAISREKYMLDYNLRRSRN